MPQSDGPTERDSINLKESMDSPKYQFLNPSSELRDDPRQTRITIAEELVRRGFSRI